MSRNEYYKERIKKQNIKRILIELNEKQYNKLKEITKEKNITSSEWIRKKIEKERLNK
ncbi:MAG: hypothetical protein HG454_003885 [Clostridiales bacterium]|nr:hypothetical protein [Clostridiales bacterium]